MAVATRVRVTKFAKTDCPGYKAMHSPHPRHSRASMHFETLEVERVLEVINKQTCP